MSIDHGSLVGHHPFSASLVAVYKPYLAAAQSFLSHAYQLWLLVVDHRSNGSDGIVAVIRCNPDSAIGQGIDVLYPEIDAIFLVDFFAHLHELADVGIVYVELSVVGDAPQVVVGGRLYLQDAVGRENVFVVWFVTEGMECVSIIIGDAVPGAKPHEFVLALFHVGDGVGGKSVDNGELAYVAVRVTASKDANSCKSRQRYRKKLKNSPLWGKIYSKIGIFL